MKQNTAKIWRMHTDKSICPHGLRAKDLLIKKGFKPVDHLLKSKDQIDSFKQKHNVKTTPQIWIGEERIGGYDDLCEYFDIKGKQKNGVDYSPIIAIFSLTALSAIAIQWSNANVVSAKTALYFVALSMIVLAIQKLRDIEAFVLGFITYDLLAMKKIRYAYFYPFAEAYTGIGMLSGASPWLFAPVGIFIGSIGAFSVVKAVYIEKRDLKCACVGGNSAVPLGLISLIENVFMFGVGLAMLVF